MSERTIGDSSASLLKQHADSNWFVRAFGQELGPMPLGDLRLMAESGELAASDEIRPADLTTWASATVLLDATEDVDPEEDHSQEELLEEPVDDNEFAEPDDTPDAEPFESQETEEPSLDESSLPDLQDMDSGEILLDPHEVPAATAEADSGVPPKPSFVKSKTDRFSELDDDAGYDFDPDTYKLQLPKPGERRSNEKTPPPQPSKLTDTVAETSLESAAIEAKVFDDVISMADDADAKETIQPDVVDDQVTAEDDVTAPSDHFDAGEEEAIHPAYEEPKEVVDQPDAKISRARDDNYFCWRDSREDGPMDYDRLQRRVTRNRLRHGQFVKRESDGRWIEATTIAGLFPDVPVVVPGLPRKKRVQPATIEVAVPKDWETPTDFEDDTSEGESSFEISETLAADLHCDDEDDFLARRVDPAAEPEPAKELKSNKSRWNDTFWGLEDRDLRWRRTLRHPYFHRLIVLTVIGFGVWYYLIPTPVTTVYDRFIAINKEIEYKRAHKTTRLQWEEYITATRAELDPIIENLEKTASSDDRVRQELLWAGRDCLIKMLSNTVTERVLESEQEFELHMETAKKLMEGGSMDLVPIPE